MNNKITKIVIVVLTLIIISVVILMTQKSIGEFIANQSVQPFDFSSYIKHIIDVNTSNPMTQTKSKYVEVYDIITTEGSIQSNNGQVISPDELRDCYEYAFQAYWSVYQNDLDIFFSKKQKEWAKSNRIKFKNELEDLKKRNGCTSKQVSEIEKYENYLTQYESALKLIERSKNCNNKDAYDAMVNKCGSYNIVPYSNASDLQSKLANVPSNARNSWRNFVMEKIRALYSKEFYDNDNKADFNKEYQSVRKIKEEYSNKFPQQDRDITDLWTQLDIRSEFWSEYYLKKNNPQTLY